MTERSMGQSAAAGGTFAIGGDLTVNRLGFGAMRITGKGIWGEPADPDEARAVLRRAVELGVNLIDTAGSYGPDVSERLIGETLAPYPEDMVIATKAGLVRSGPGQWDPDGRPEHIREALEGSLSLLKLETIDLYQLHRIDPKVPMEDQLGTMAELRDEGKVRHVGLSEVGVEEIEKARQIVPIATVQNRYNLTDRDHEDVLDFCEREGIGFVPWFPLATGDLARPGSPLDEIASSRGVAPGQIALSWLLHRSPIVLPIPGTSSVSHLKENIAAASIELTDEEFEELSNISGS
ncbi:MAG: aldo/keto reductase [Actinomycetota bacterium]|nr:aldo/keto reductase [Actinomycetota bacterium]